MLDCDWSTSLRPAYVTSRSLPSAFAENSVVHVYRYKKILMKTLKIKNKMRPIDAKKGEIKKSLLIAQEIKMARLLTNNDKRIRDKVLKRLKKWLTVRSQSSFGKSVGLHITFY